MKNKEVKISFFASHITTIITVAMVLLLVGVIASVWIGVANETQRLKERFEVCVVMGDSITNEQTVTFADQLSKRPYAAKVQVVTKEQALENWKRDTGEDLMALYGVNPLSPEVLFTTPADYAESSRIEAVKREVSRMPGVDSVGSPDASVVTEMNRNLSGLTLILSLVAGVMLIISFVLINNTVQLAIYSRRFTIHTMQLVGATRGFISRPYVLNNMACGALAGVLAMLLLVGVIFGAEFIGINDLISYIGWIDLGLIGAGMVILGVVICLISAWVATQRYLRKDYDELFK